MFHPFPKPLRLRLSALLIAGITLCTGHLATAQDKEKDGKPHLRIICVSSLVDNQDVVLASRDDKGNWQEYGTCKLRSSLITEWLPARTGELDLTIREGSELKSICHFTYPSDTKRALAVLLPNLSKKTFTADVIDPSKMKFGKGSTLLVNYSPVEDTVVLGGLKTRLKPGERMIVKPQPEANGMYRMMAAYTDAKKELVPCYDRYVSSNQDARDIIFLLPDSTLGLKVFSLSEFGPFD